MLILSCQRELHTQSEVMNSSGIRTATQQRCIGLTVEEETHRK